MKIPEPKNNIASLIDSYHESKQDMPRPHMGCSQLGHYCDRWLWLSFRWAVQPSFPGRILRLFRRGHMEEDTIVDDLRRAGIKIQYTGRNQKNVSFGSHVSGSIDGIIENGVPEAINKRHIAEFKTHSLKSFNDLEKNGVEKSKPVHFVQMQVYMLGTGIDRALYLAVCKDDDRIYTERVKLDKSIAEKYIDRGKRIALSDEMPPPISTDPTWYQCKFCDAHEFCHKTHITKHVNCRTCAHSTPMNNSTWRCERHDANDIPVDFQRTGCDCHVLHPDLVPYDRKECDNGLDAIYVINGVDVRNGEPDTFVYSSKEILANPGACSSGDSIENAARGVFGGAFVEDDDIITF